ATIGSAGRWPRAVCSIEVVGARTAAANSANAQATRIATERSTRRRRSAKAERLLSAEARRPIQHDLHRPRTVVIERRDEEEPLAVARRGPHVALRRAAREMPLKQLGRQAELDAGSGFTHWNRVERFVSALIDHFLPVASPRRHGAAGRGHLPFAARRR